MDRKDLRSGNLLLLKNLLKERGRSTKPQLAAASGLSVVTVNSIMKTLVENGEVEELAAAPSTGGRPAAVYRFRADRRLFLTACMSKTADKKSLLSVFVGDILTNTVATENFFAEGNMKPSFAAKKLSPFIEKYPQLSFVTALADAETKEYFAASGEMNDMPLESFLTAKLSRPVYVETELKAAAAACENLFGKSTDDEVFVAINYDGNAPPTAAIIVGGKIFKGKDGIAGEIGKRFFSGTYHKPLDGVREAARIVSMLTRTWNPHGIVFYGDELSPDNTGTIIDRCGREIPTKFLPTVIIRQNMAEDAANGIKILAWKRLAAIGLG